jgi:hypothetical protein
VAVIRRGVELNEVRNPADIAGLRHDGDDAPVLVAVVVERAASSTYGQR